MNIVKHTYSFAWALSKRRKTTDIILHHAAAKRCSVNDIHSWHLQNGWAGIGYHFLVRKDGSVHECRPIDTVGAHAGNHNSYSIGICFEGNFEVETMSDAQKKAGAELVSYIKGLYPTIKTVGKHKDYCSTSCPGKNFPFAEIAAGVKVEPEKKEEIKKEEVKKDNDFALISLKTGQALTLEREPLYISSTATKRSSTVNGTYYVWSDDVVCGRIRITNAKTKAGITGQVTGWIDAPKTKAITKGCLVRLKKGAKTYTGGSLASFVYERNHTVKEIVGDRVVITFGGVVVAAVNKTDLTLVG